MGDTVQVNQVFSNLDELADSVKQLGFFLKKTEIPRINGGFESTNE